ncbi:alpha/beta hydrolase family protein [Flavihumibacter profundi]|uniref:alpha/beta hydrolase family protein n=1 Tax=Flavihumibacter profundi TaxID=2716883 RepID=UPI001CC50C61|nr:prolyl oligopeptidase family serine peptidase [Flavihumibacter profundi]MBZ5858399.1 prolyl oligopeptidase family serine peptidase [Flavihumibacter profundi]
MKKTLLFVWFALGIAVAASAQEKELPLPGEVFSVAGSTAFLILPEKKTTDRSPVPWVWYAPTLPGLPAKEELWMFRQFLAAGIAIAGIDVGESMGNKAGRKTYTALYNELVKKRHFSAHPVLLARSRGGLMLYNWAVEHPQEVGAIAGIYPVGDLSSYPGLEKAAIAYGWPLKKMKRKLAGNNPVNRVKPLAKARVPILHLHGDVDELVPLAQNSGAIAAEYKKYGGPMTLLVQKGQGHNMWEGFFQSQELVDFVISNALKKP